MEGIGCVIALVTAFVVMTVTAVFGALAYTGIISLGELVPWN